jgi:hypothetical protein
MGQLLEYLKTAAPPEAEPMTPGLFGIIPYRLPPIHFKDPGIGPEPLNLQGPVEKRSDAGPVDGPALVRLSERWPARMNSHKEAIASAMDATQPSGGSFDTRWVDPGASLAFAPVGPAIAWPLAPQ